MKKGNNMAFISPLTTWSLHGWCTVAGVWKTVSEGLENSSKKSGFMIGRLSYKDGRAFDMFLIVYI